MSIYRTKTYIAGDWDGDRDAVEKLRQWNDSNYWNLSFTDAHDLTQARDNSLNCSIKASLKKRMDASKRFVLIVGEKTDSVRAGSCYLCNNYSNYSEICKNRRYIDKKSFIKYECNEAIKSNITIIVLYKSTRVDKEKCPESLRNKGNHYPMWQRDSDGNVYWDYQTVKRAFDSI